MFGTRLKQLRVARGLTQQQLADLLHVGRPTIAGYETKGKEPDFEKLRFLASYFDVSIDYLLGESDDPGTSSKKNSGPLTVERGDQIIQRALRDTGLLEPDGSLSDKGLKVISEFLSSNAAILKKLIENSD